MLFVIIIFFVKNLFIYVIEPASSDWLKDIDNRVVHGIQFGKARGFLQSGDPIVIVTGWKKGSGYTNTIRIVYVPEKEDFSLIGN